MASWDEFWSGPVFVVVAATEKAMAPHSSTLAWKIPWMEEPGGLPSTGLHRVGHDWSDLAVAVVAQLVKSPPAMWETWVQSLGIFYFLNYENETNLQETWKI